MGKRVTITVEKYGTKTETFEIPDGEDVDLFIDEMAGDMVDFMSDFEDEYEYSIEED